MQSRRPTTDEGLRRLDGIQPRRVALAATILAATLALSATASASPPAAQWHPVNMTASHSNVSVTIESPTNARVQEVRLVNNNPFTVVVRDLEMSQLTNDGLERLSVHNNEIYLRSKQVQVVRMTAGPVRRAKTSLLQSGQPQPRFAVFVEDATIEQLGAYTMAMAAQEQPGWYTPPKPAQLPEHQETSECGNDDAINVNVEPLGSAWTAGIMETMLHNQIHAARASGYKRLSLLEQSKEVVAKDRRRLTPMACSVESRQLSAASGDEAEVLSLDRFAALHQAAEHDKGLLSCFSPALMGELATRALKHGRHRLAVSIAEPFANGVMTPEPFRDILVENAFDDVDRWWKAYEDFDEGSYALASVMDRLDKLYELDPANPGMSRLLSQTLWYSAKEARRSAREKDFPQARYILDLMERADRPLRTMRTPHKYPDLLDTTRADVDYAEARHIFHYRRGSHEMLDEADRLFEKASAHHPTSARLYQFGIVLFRHQFTALGAVLLFIMLVWLGLRSQTLARWRVRLKMWRLNLTARDDNDPKGTEQAWRVLTDLMALKDDDLANARFKGLAAARLTQTAMDHMEDQNLLAEAARQMGQLQAPNRPVWWQSSLGALNQMATEIDAGADHQRLHKHKIMVERAFGPAQSMAAAALVHEARCRQMAKGGARRAELHHQYTTAVESLTMAADDERLDVELGDLMSARLGSLQAAMGPALEGHRAWSDAWNRLEGLDASAFGPTVVHSRTMAAAAAAPLEQAVEAIENTAALDIDQRRAALVLTARRASLPLPDTQGNPSQHAQRQRAALMALARLDNLLTQHVSPREALEARLRVAILRRLGGHATGQLDADVEYRDDITELFEQARQPNASDHAVQLASVLDLLTEGDWGFDDAVAAAQGAQRSLFQLLEALDHHAAGRDIQAAAALADMNPEAASEPRAVRLLCARALVAAQLGQLKAATSALGRAADQARTESALATVERTAARLLGVLLVDVEQDGADAQTIEALALGVIGALADGTRSAPVVPWHRLALVLIGCGRSQEAWLALQRSHALESDPNAVQARKEVLMELSRLELLSGNYDKASKYVMMAENGSLIATDYRTAV